MSWGRRPTESYHVNKPRLGHWFPVFAFWVRRGVRYYTQLYVMCAVMRGHAQNAAVWELSEAVFQRQQRDEDHMSCTKACNAALSLPEVVVLTPADGSSARTPPIASPRRRLRIGRPLARSRWSSSPLMTPAATCLDACALSTARDHASHSSSSSSSSSSHPRS